MSEWPKPVVVLSRCLELEPVRYNGQVIPYDFVRELEPWVTFVPVCPELEIGLGVPRAPIRIVEVDGQARLWQPETDRDVTAEMREFADGYLAGLSEVDGFILKNRSPSCGISDVKLYQGRDPSAMTKRGPGFFGGRVLDLYQGLAIEDEGRLRNFRIREHFLTKLFCLARFRILKASATMKELIGFHSDHKFLLMAYHQQQLRVLGRIVANSDRAPLQRVVEEYERNLRAALASAPRSTSVINVLQHVSGYFSKQLSRSEKAFFQSWLEKYRNGRIPVSALTSILRAWVVRFAQEYLLTQTFFDPYPEVLSSVSDSGKGREV